MWRHASSLMAVGLLTLSGCSSLYYNTMEKVGVHKRDIMVDRVKEARDAQQAARTQFVSALEQFQSVVQSPGGDLQAKYNKLHATLEQSEARATEIHDRIDAVENVSDALFAEWRKELKQYSSDTLRKTSQREYDATRGRYKALIAAMKAAESKLEPVLIPLRDQVLFLKHNLNAQAIAGLGAEVTSIETNVDALIREMDAAIREADAFIAQVGTP